MNFGGNSGTQGFILGSVETSHQALRVTHVIPSIAEQASGPSQVVPPLCEALARAGANVELQLLAPRPLQQLHGVKVIVHPRWPLPNRFGMSLSLWRSLRSSVGRCNIMHGHSLWMMPNIAPGLLISSSTSARLVFSPHGTLGKWAFQHHRWRKKLIWWCGQQFVLTRAACFHATAESEAEDIRRFGFRQPIAVIPNGINIPDDYYHGPIDDSSRRILFMGRLHPIKGLDLLIHAWASISHAHEDWELLIAGPEDYVGYERVLRGLVEHLAAPRVVFVGALYDHDKTKLLHSCDLFVLPSHNENFGMVVAEALAHGVPVIASRGTPWAELEREGCGWWIENDVEAIQGCLDFAMGLPRSELMAMGARGRDWMVRDFGWDGIAHRMIEVYLWLLSGGPQPTFVRLN